MNASFLIRKCVGRGATPMTIGPSMLCEWLTAKITGPVAGTFQAPSTRGFHSPYIRPTPMRRPTSAPRSEGTDGRFTSRPASPRRA